MKSLRETFMKCQKINSCKFDVKLVTKWVRDLNLSAIDVEDDQNTDLKFKSGIFTIY